MSATIDWDLNEADEVTLVFGQQGYIVFGLADVADEIQDFYHQLLAGAQYATLTLNEDCEYQLIIEPDAITCRTLAMEDGGHIAGVLALSIARSPDVDAKAMDCISQLAAIARQGSNN